MSGLRVLEFIDEKEAKNPKKFWIITYLLVFIAPLILAAGLYLLLEFLGFSTTLDDDTTRYLLSAFIQSLAAVIAIVVSLTLVAIQFTASEYSSRVIEVFKKNPAMWAIIAGYISGISLFAFILMGISDLVSGIKSYEVFYSFFLFIALLVTLIPHIRITLNSMNAEKVIDNLFDDLTSEKLTGLKPEDDPFHDLFVIINSSAIKGDMVTFSYGLKRIREKFIEITVNPDPDLYLNYILFRFCDGIKKTSLILFEKREEVFIAEIVSILEELLEISFENIAQPDSRLDSMIPSLIAEIGVKAIDENYVIIHTNCIIKISRKIKSLSKLYLKSKNKVILTQIRRLFDNLSDFGYAFMKNGESINFIKIAFIKIGFDKDIYGKKNQFPPEIVNLLVDYNKEFVYIYMKSPECQKGKYYIEPIRELVSYSKYSNLKEEEIKKILEILKDIGRDAFRKYNLPEITILVKREMFDLGLYFMDKDNSKFNDIVVDYLAKLHYLCDGLEEIENDSKNRFAYRSGVYAGEKELEYRRGLIYTDMLDIFERSYSCSDEEAEYIQKRVYIE